MTEPYLPKHDFDGRPIADMSSYELRRRLANNRRDGDNHPISNAYNRAYEAALLERERVKLRPCPKCGHPGGLVYCSQCHGPHRKKMAAQDSAASSRLRSAPPSGSSPS